MTAKLPTSDDIRDLAVEQGAGHHQALDLVGSLVDLGDLSPGRADLEICPQTAGEMRNYISVVLAGSRLCPTSDGLGTA